MTGLSARCPAKINLGLEVLGRRPDGYHDLVTILQTIDLSDSLAVELADDLILDCSEPDLSTTNNLCLRAAHALQAATGVHLGARLTLDKLVPAAAGLGGGSSDAAATLRLLNALWATGLSTADLEPLAAGLGADVPFFLRGGTALATGIGDCLTPLPDAAPTWLVLVQPALAIESKTARLYRALTTADWSDGARTLAQADRLRAGAPLDPVLIVNAFARPLRDGYPQVAAHEAVLREASADVVFPAGSGPTLVALTAGRAAAVALADCLRSAGLVARIASTSPASQAG